MTRRRRTTAPCGPGHPALALVALSLSAALLVLVAGASLARAETAGAPQWTIGSVSGPTNFAPGGEGRYVVTATNVGGEATSGETVIEDTLPEGVTETAISGSEAFAQGTLACEAVSVSERRYRCAFVGPVDPGDSLTVVIKLQVGALPEGPLPRINQASVTGGGAAAGASTAEPTTTPTLVSSSPARFGIAGFAMSASAAQAAGHPNLTTSFSVNRSEASQPADGVRDVGVELPPGFLGNPLSTPRCDISDVTLERCPEDTAVGVATVAIAATEGAESFYKTLVYDIAPYPDEPAAFAFQLVNGEVTVRLDTSVRLNDAGEYVVRVSVPQVSEAEPVLSTSVTFWGVPARYNGPGPDQAEGGRVSFGGPGVEADVAKPFLRNPSHCGPAQAGALQIDSWQEAGAVDASGTPALGDARWKTAASSLAPMTSCDLLAPLFQPSIGVAPDRLLAGAPAGYGLSLATPQNENPSGPATPDLREVVLALPLGTVPSPSAANGLQACGDAEFGAVPASTASLPANCPQASKIGEVQIETPLLAKPLQGQLFLGQPECAPCGPGEAAEGRLLRVFLQAQYGSGSNVRVKLAGRAHVDQATGRITTVFADTPELPFSSLKVSLKGGEGAPLANPVACGPATSSSRLSPWSETPAAEPGSSFEVSFDGTGAPCPSPLPFAPPFSAQTTQPVAGGFSPFTLAFGRGDREQELSGIVLQTPPGLLGMLSSVALCGEPQASDGTCGAASQIGEVSVDAGPGARPYRVTGGRVYLTGPYADAPFGLSIVVPVVAGPFDLGTEVVRAKIEVDPTTAALTVTTPSLPRQKDGIPFQIKDVQADIDRPGFMFNPTNCSAQAIAATIAGSQGANARASSPFAVGNCAGLSFKPGFSVSTNGRTSRAIGASLHVTVTSGAGQANIESVHVSLPKKLPSRLSTLKLACTERQFAVNPAGCPSGSLVGVATAHTPVLPVPLTGPAIFVSHGGAAFPDLDIVLQGDGVTVVLTGNTFISKGITSSTFATVPDVPVTRFDLVLDQGPHSALGATADLCTAGRTVTSKKRVRRRVHGRTRRVTVKRRVPALTMPTRIVAQNGARTTRTTKIAVLGCKAPGGLASARRQPRAVKEKRTGR